MGNKCTKANYDETGNIKSGHAKRGKKSKKSALKPVMPGPEQAAVNHRLLDSEISKSDTRKT